MRVWDVAAGYLSRQSLLGEHRELHGLYNIVSQGKRGYSRHPETLRWVGALSGLAWRHEHLAAEMRLRGYVDRTPLRRSRTRVAWPSSFVTNPVEQFDVLSSKYGGLISGRIPLPRNPSELWAQHKYSVMARDLDAYREFGRLVSRLRRGAPMARLAEDLVMALRPAPARGPLVNAIEHMWGHVKRLATSEERQQSRASAARQLSITQQLAVQHAERFLMASTALSELSTYGDSLRSS